MVFIQLGIPKQKAETLILRRKWDKFFRAEYDSLRQDLLKYRKEFAPPEVYGVDYLLAVHSIISGRPEAGLRLLNSIEATGNMSRFVLREGIPEMRGLALRLMGKLPEAVKVLVGAAQRLLESGSAYAVFPLAKAIGISRFARLDSPPQGLIRRCLSLARKGAWGERAAATEIEALLAEDNARAAEGLFEAARNYHRAYQNIEAHLASLVSAYLAWQTESPIFPGVARFLAPLIHLHPGFKKDPIFGDFQEGLEMFLVRVDESKKAGIEARLIGEFRVSVGGREIPMRNWQNDKAIKALLYLLLSPKHRLPKDHLFYLLWPDARYNPQTKHRLHVAASLIRKNLGDSNLLVSARDFYQIENVWTDLEELEGLVQRAEASQSSDEREEYLAMARDLAKGELLPEFLYDQQVDEYRQYYERLRKKLFGG